MNEQPEATKTVASATEVLRGIPTPKGDVRRLSPLQAAGVRLALGVGLAIALVTAAVLVDWFQGRPGFPSVSAATTQGQAGNLVQNFKELNELSFERSTKIFDLIVVKAFLPVFTAILGYIFGSREGREE